MQRSGGARRFVLVGDGPLRTTLQKKHPDLIFCGEHTGEALARCYASADVFLFASETETFGNVTLEAMASGLVVVAYHYAAAHMHITHDKTGVLVPYGDAQAFLDAAAEIARQPQSLQTIRRQARVYAASIDWQHVVKRFATLLSLFVPQTSAICRHRTLYLGLFLDHALSACRLVLAARARNGLLRVGSLFRTIDQHCVVTITGVPTHV